MAKVPPAEIYISVPRGFDLKQLARDLKDIFANVSFTYVNKDTLQLINGCYEISVKSASPTRIKAVTGFLKSRGVTVVKTTHH